MRLIYQYLVEAALFISGVAIIALGYSNNLVTSLLLLALLGIELLFWHERQDALIFLVGGVVGPIGEIIAIYFGAWQYSNPTFLGIPIWLPLAWGIISASVKRISDTLYATFK